jgi:hypothetical protein
MSERDTRARGNGEVNEAIDETDTASEAGDLTGLIPSVRVSIACSLDHSHLARRHTTCTHSQ